MRFRSEDILAKKWENVPSRACLKATGFSDFELKNRPIIGIVNSGNNIVSGHYHLSELAGFVTRGIYAAGGTAVEFGVIAGCDGVADGHIGMNYSLPSREIICDSIQVEGEMSRLDAIVMLASCDKIVPAMIMAAARLDIPAILVNGGPMEGGAPFDGRKSDLTSTDEAKGMYSAHLVSRQQVMDLEDSCCPTCGSCAFLGTANSMCCIAEALGMSLTGSALVPATYAERRRIAFESGRQICALAKSGITARQILTESAIRNAVKVSLAIAGSTNVVLHLSAIAKEAGIDINVVDEYEKYCQRIPYLAKVNPASPYDMEDFYHAGGIPRVMQTMSHELELEVLTCTGKTMRENLNAVRYSRSGNEDVIRPWNRPFSQSGGISVLRGNLAPDTAISKPGAISEKLHHFVGTARVFDSEEAANTAILHREIVAGDVVVIRYEGPKGGPGMREMCQALKYLYGQGLAEHTALITDGRFSGTNNGCFVGHISPEAAEGGPIAVVQDGDRIEIDVDKGTLELLISDAELCSRMAQWKPIKKEIPRGYLRRYAKHVSSAAAGAVYLED